MSGNVTDLLQQGITAAKAQRVDEARRTLMRVVELDDHNEQAWLWLSGVVESPDDRRVCLENVLTINPDNALAQSGLRWLNEHAPAAWERCPHCQAPLPASGNTCPACKQPVLIVCPNCGEFTEVVKARCIHCSHFFGDFRQRARYYATLAADYADTGNLSPAKWAVDQAVSSIPDEADLWQRIAQVRAQLDRPDDAIAAYQQAIRRAPEQSGLYLELHDLYRRNQRSAEAQAIHERMLRQFQDDHARLVEIGQALAECRDSFDEVVRFFKRAVELQPQHAGTQLLLGALYFDQRDFAMARQHFAHAVKLTHAKSAQGQEARQALERAKAAGAPRAASGRGEMLRQLAGPLLISIMAALANARFSPLNIHVVSWLGLGLSLMGAWLWVTASHEQRAAARQRRGGATGLIVWLIGFGLILVGA